MKYKFQINMIRRSSSKQTLIQGITTELGKPVSRQVRVYSRTTGLLIKAIQSDQSGYYKMYLPDMSPFTLVSIDRYRKFNAVIQDNVVPK